MGTLAVDVYDGSWNLNEWTLSGQQHSSSGADYLKPPEIDLSTYSGDIKIRFRGVDGSSYKGDMAIDDIMVVGSRCD